MTGTQKRTMRPTQRSYISQNHLSGNSRSQSKIHCNQGHRPRWQVPMCLRVLFCCLLVIPSSQLKALNQEAAFADNRPSEPDLDSNISKPAPTSSGALSSTTNVFDESATDNLLDAHLEATTSEPLFRPVFTSIKGSERHTYSYVINASVLERSPAIQVQIYAETESAALNDSDLIEEDKLFPLLVTVHWHYSVRSWEIPIHFTNSTEDFNLTSRYSDGIVSKTLWDYPEKKPIRSWNLSVEFSIPEDATVYYKLKIVVIKNFNIALGETVPAKVSASSPSFYQFKIPPRPIEFFFLHAVSDNTICTLISIQQPRGPFLDTDETSVDLQYSETFTEKAGLTIKASDFPNGFLVVFLPFENDGKCRSHIRFGNNTFEETSDLFRQKTLTFQIREGKSTDKYFGPMMMPILLFLCISVVVLTIQIGFHNYKLRYVIPNREKPDIISRPNGRFQSDIMMPDLIITSPSRVVDQTRRYCRAGLVTSAFYCVPVFQLIFIFSKQLLDTGNFDICYFNHFCSHRLWKFHDFNHMYSNIWYVLLGLLYLVVVSIRQFTSPVIETESEIELETSPSPDVEASSDTTNSSTSTTTTANTSSSSSSSSSSDTTASTSTISGNESGKNPVFRFLQPCPVRSDRGVMAHYGLLYSMGFALIMTGVMSAGYHICPNQSNFQFDTVFMYTIAAITVVAMYQSRHPTYLSANFTFTALALVTFITVLGLLWEEMPIRVLFSLVHFIFLVFALPKVCFNGYIRKNGALVNGWRDVMKILMYKFYDDWKNGRIWAIQRTTWISPKDPSISIIPGPGRLVLPGFLSVINVVAIGAMWTFFKNENFATQVLFICVINGSLYTIFYSALKIVHGECRRILWIQPGIYLTASFALWGYALVYFFDQVSTWENSPAESRIMNTDCNLLGFYDSHDLWHFLSAASLFSSAMVLLTVDDDLVDQPRSTIPVF